MSDLCSIERVGRAAIIRMLRTDKHNAFNRELNTAVSAALGELDADTDVSVALLAGSGTAFSAGADMSEAVAAIEGKGRSEGMAQTYAAVAAFRKPLVACINGICYGGGSLVATMCDVRIAADSAAFRFPGAVYGLVVAGAQLPRIIGPAFAKELLFTGRVVDAEEALRIGLVNRIVPFADVEAASIEMAVQIAENSAPALIAVKQVVDRASEIDEALAAEGECNRGLRTTPEHHDRFRAAAARVVRPR